MTGGSTRSRSSTHSHQYARRRLIWGDLIHSYDSFVGLLEARPPDVRPLAGLKDLQTWLAHDALSWTRQAEEQTRIAHLWRTRLAADVVREGLRDESTRSLALLIIEENELRELLP